MEKPKRARMRKLDTAKVNLEPSLRHSGGQGVWQDVGTGMLKTNLSGWVAIPPPPSDDDWGMRLLLRK